MARLVFVVLAWSLVSAVAAVAAPDHPILTEIYRDPPGANDGPVGRDPANLHQEYIEIHLPSALELRPGLSKDALRLAIYEVEGDASSSGNGLVEYRIDLPTFDLDPTNGLTPGAVGRPVGGKVILGWVDYLGNPPTALAGTANTRVALVDGGVTATTDSVFVAVNGDQFGGTANFPVPAAVSGIDLFSTDAFDGFMDDGSAVYLLVDRDDPGYVERWAFDDPLHQPAVPNADLDLDAGTVLGVSAVLDAFAANDDTNFDVRDQPYAPPTGDDIDLETVLPAGGPFTLLAAQVPEGSGNGFARNLIDLPKTTEDGTPGNEDPAADAQLAYRSVSEAGPLGPDPGWAPAGTSPPLLDVARDAVQVFEVLKGTVGRPGLHAANAGGDFAMSASASPSAPSDPGLAALGAGDASVAPLGLAPVNPSVALEPSASAAPGSSLTATVTVTASTVNPADPATLEASAVRTASFVVRDPVTGTDAAGLPFQATTLLAVQAIAPDPATANEFLSTDFGAFAVLGLQGGLVQDSFGNGTALVNAATDLSDALVVDALDESMPDDPLFFIDVPAPAGTPGLFSVVSTSAEVASGSGTYDASLDLPTGRVAAIPVAIPETRTRGGVFIPGERVHFADAKGLPGRPTSGFSNARSRRGFELVLLESQVTASGALETGATDDFGLVVEAGAVVPGASVLPGEFVMLSFSGGLEGADVDSLDVPPGGGLANLIYLDLDLLDTVLGVETITRLFVVDGSGSGAIELLEVFSANASPCSDGIDNDGDGSIDYPADTGCLGATGLSELPDCADGIDNDGDGMTDFGADPGCGSATGRREAPQCQDGIDNDGQIGTDFDGGESVLGFGNGDPAGPDPECVGAPAKNREAQSSGRACGIGPELALLLPLAALRLRRRRRRSDRTNERTRR